jgi:hypothetical protein
MPWNGPDCLQYPFITDAFGANCFDEFFAQSLMLESIEPACKFDTFLTKKVPRLKSIWNPKIEMLYVCRNT